MWAEETADSFFYLIYFKIFCNHFKNTKRDLIDNQHDDEADWENVYIKPVLTFTLRRRKSTSVLWADWWITAAALVQVFVFEWVVCEVSGEAETRSY